ncbi:MAG TPA: substrate-binding and VWA domain-containing protein [Ktedonobacterales bacterium]|nr:substrate-binding and VWA domain-containing protein [Ktedonobacterales bacterium]
MVTSGDARGARLRLLLRVLSFMLVLLALASCDSGQIGQNNQGGGGGGNGSCPAKTSSPVTLNFYYGSEKQAWIEDVVKVFNQECAGSVKVNATPLGSGQSMQMILNGDKPDIWSPAGSVWLTLMNQQWQAKYSTTIISTGPTDTPSLVTSPVVIGMWKPEAEALGWPNKPISWADIAALSTNPQGWAAYGHPEWGDFKFGHTHPDYSNSGLDAIIAENYAAVSKKHDLTTADVDSATAKNFVSNVESSIIHYGDSTGTFAAQMFNGGPGYLSADVMYESLVVEANTPSLYPHLPYPVVAIYPSDGTFYSDHPFAILQASWVTPAKKAAAAAFRDYLLAPAQQRKALQYGFRPSDLNIPISAPVDSAHGVDPKQPQSVLQVPSADVINAIKASWDEQRRKVDVMLILDRSGSMNDSIGGTSKIAAARQGLAEFVGLLGDNDGLGLTVFSTDTNVLTPISQLGPKRQSVLDTINGVIADGNTRLYDTIAEQYEALQKLQTKYIKAIVVLTDGDDTISQRTLAQVVQEVTASGENAGEAIKIYTIAYGSDADTSALTQIANASGGQEYAGTPQNIQAVYQSISEFF